MDEDGGGVRVGLIRAATRTIRSGTREIETQLSQVRGVLSKAAVRDLHKQVKDLRQTAENAEEAFRDWTIELSAKPGADAEKAEYESLRIAFEAEVSGIQRSMTRVAEEVKRRQASKAAAKADSDAVGIDALDSIEDAAPRSTPSAVPDLAASISTDKVLPEKLIGGEFAQQQPKNSLLGSDDLALHRPAPSVQRDPLQGSRASGSSTGHTPKHPARSAATPARASAAPSRPARSIESMTSSHVAMANTFRAIASQEEETSYHVIAPGTTSLDKQVRPALREHGLSRWPPWMKYLVWVALISFTWTVWQHARFLALSSLEPSVQELQRQAFRSSQMSRPNVGSASDQAAASAPTASPMSASSVAGSGISQKS